MIVFLVGGQLAHEHPEVFLDGEEECSLVRKRGRGASKAESSAQFVYTAASFNTRMGFGDAPVEEEAGLARVAEFCGDAHGVRKAKINKVGKQRGC